MKEFKTAAEMVAFFGGFALIFWVIATSIRGCGCP